MKGKKTLTLLLLLVMTIACLPAPGSQKKQEHTVEVTVFADLDSDGKQDLDEPGIPEALVAYQHNEHGFFTRGSALTNDEGKTSVTGLYTHFFDVGIVPPCGYTSTTEIARSAIGEAKLAFGFTPTAPQEGKAQVLLRLWLDADGDGVHDPEENPAEDIDLLALPYESGVGFLWSDAPDVDAFRAQTDQDGAALFELGNTCGKLTVKFPENLTFSSSEPAAAVQENDLVFSYETGVTEFDIGLKE